MIQCNRNNLWAPGRSEIRLVFTSWPLFIETVGRHREGKDCCSGNLSRKSYYGELGEDEF